jgi:hypothetical protein
VIFSRVGARAREWSSTRADHTPRANVERPWTPTIWVLAIAPPLLAMAWLIPTFVHRDFAADWLTYVRGTTAIFEGRSPYASWQLAGPYGLNEASDGAGYVYPPAAAVVLAPIIGSPELLATANYTLYAVGLLAIAARSGRLSPVVAAVILWSTAFHPGMVENIIVGNTSGVLAGALAFSPVLFGALLVGFAASVKLFPAVWALDPLRRRPAPTLALVIAGVLVPTLVAVILAGPAPWIDYVNALANARPSSTGRLTLAHLGLPTLLIYGLGLLVVGLTLRVPEKFRLLGMGAAACLVAPDLPLSYSLLLSPGIVSLWAARDRQGDGASARA